MNDFREIFDKCKKLPFSKEKNLTDGVYSDTDRMLNSLFKEYGPSKVLSALSRIWSFEKTTLYFTKDKERNTPEKNSRKIKTIATYRYKNNCRNYGNYCNNYHF